MIAEKTSSMFASRWLDAAELEALHDQAAAHALNALKRLYWPVLPLCQIDNLLNCAMLYWAVGPRMAAHRLSDERLIEVICNAYKKRTVTRSNGVIILEMDDGEYRYVYAATRRNFAKLLTFGALHIRWLAEEGEKA